MGRSGERGSGISVLPARYDDDDDDDDDFIYTLLLGYFKFPDKCFGFRLELVDEFTEFVSSAFRPFIGHHQRMFARVNSVFYEKKKKKN